MAIQAQNRDTLNGLIKVLQESSDVTRGSNLTLYYARLGAIATIDSSIQNLKALLDMGTDLPEEDVAEVLAELESMKTTYMENE